ncbi:MAG: ABC transporter permease subunit [Clostridia bacterium]|nr:ABC transporter permease subunit [Clostridia bacterium]
MNKKKLYQILNYALPFVTVVIIVAVYAIISKVVDIELIAPSVGATLKELFALLGQGYFYKAVGGTLLRALIAYVLSFALALILAILTKFCAPLRRALLPIVALVRVLPTMSLVLLALIWFKSFQATVLVAFCIIFPMLYTGMCDAIDGVDKDLIEMARVYGVGKRRLIEKLYIPQALPSVFTSIKSSIGLNLKIVISAEVLAQTADSMGLYMQLAKINLDTAILLAWTIVAIVIGGIIEGIVSLIAKKAVKWL